VLDFSDRNALRLMPHPEPLPMIATHLRPFPWLAPLLSALAFPTLARDLVASESYAFLVAVQHYDKAEFDSLEYTENDVRELAGVLEKTGYRSDNIVLMTQSTGARNTRYLPTAANIRRELRLMLSELGSQDTVLLAFSGHGLQFSGEKESYFCAADARLADRSTLIALGEVYRALDQCPVAAKVLLVDACRNDPRSKLAKSARKSISLETVARPQALAPPGGIAALFSCSAGQQSYEHPVLQHGVFFHFVIRALSGEADLDKDREISLAELEQYAAKNVQRYSRVQLGQPQTPERRGEARGLLTLARLSDPNSISLPPTAGHVLENSLGMKLVLVPAGDQTLLFGDPRGDRRTLPQVRGRDGLQDRPRAAR
jgi:hypothetical protein